jgi:hypothetical protein
VIFFGKTLINSKYWGRFAILVRPIYRPALKTNTPITITKLKEKIMMSSDAITATIIRAKSEMGSPQIRAFFRIFL